jgi:formate hydrogenlyase transcriptional activator
MNAMAYKIQEWRSPDEIIGESPRLRTVMSQAAIVAPTDSTVLLLGETGTGKGCIAKRTHYQSERRDYPFVAVNCAAIPLGLLESELFGHERGAFTGAINQRLGRFEMANKGTLFLDEIGDIPLELQPKLLRVLQEREFERLGSTQTIHGDVRVIAATHNNLRRMTAEGKFRLDLFYRLNVFPISIPALRERREDIPLLVRHFVRQFSERLHKSISVISDSVLDSLCRYQWPGNIRELENFIERSEILSQGFELDAPVHELEMQQDDLAAAPEKLLDAERLHIARVLREANGVIGAAAVRLGLPRSTLFYKMRRLGICSSRPAQSQVLKQAAVA